MRTDVRPCAEAGLFALVASPFALAALPFALVAIGQQRGVLPVGTSVADLDRLAGSLAMQFSRPS